MLNPCFWSPYSSFAASITPKAVGGYTPNRVYLMGSLIHLSRSSSKNVRHDLKSAQSTKTHFASLSDRTLQSLIGVDLAETCQLRARSRTRNGTIAQASDRLHAIATSGLIVIPRDGNGCNTCSRGNGKAKKQVRVYDFLRLMNKFCGLRLIW